MLADVVRHGARGGREDAVDEGGRMDRGSHKHCCPSGSRELSAWPISASSIRR